MESSFGTTPLTQKTLPYLILSDVLNPNNEKNGNRNVTARLVLMEELALFFPIFLHQPTLLLTQSSDWFSDLFVKSNGTRRIKAKKVKVLNLWSKC